MITMRILRGGTLSDGKVRDILVGKRIIDIRVGLRARNSEVEEIDVRGCYVLPGGVDPHTHVNLRVGDFHVKDGWSEATRAAALGGTTSLIEHPSFGSDLQDVINEASGKSYIDFGVHAVFEPQNISTPLPRGITSGKVYMTYSGRLNDDEFLQVLLMMKKMGGLTAVHAENHAIATMLSQKFRALAPLDPMSHALARPDYCEAEAVSRAVALSTAADAPLYIVHLSTEKGLEIVRKAKRDGLEIYAETCPQYLFWTEEKYREPDGIRYIMSPPLRKQRDCDALWAGLADGTIDTVGTDHCNFDRAGMTNVFDAPGGVAGIGTRMPELFREGVLKKKISLQKFVSLTAEMPARLFGMTNKGRFEFGADADIVVIDKEGAVRNVFLRGEPIGDEMRGEFIERERFAPQRRPLSSTLAG